MKRLKTLLVSLPWADCYFPSLKIGAVGAYAKAKGFDVKVLHLHLEAAFHFGIKEYRKFIDMNGEALSAALLFPQKRKKILRKLNNYPMSKLKRYEIALRKVYKQISCNKFDVIGFTLDYYQLFSSLLVASWIKKEFPKVKIVFGGLTLSGSVGESILQCFPQVDWCISGEGERPFVKILECLSKNAQDFEHDIPGLIYRGDNGSVSNPCEQLKQLIGLPDPDYEEYFDFLDKYTRKAGKLFPAHIPVEAGRGCTDKCAFCASRLHAKGYRARPPKEVSKQMVRLTEKYNVLNFDFFDLRTQPDNDLILFKYILKQRRDYNIFYSIRADISKSLLVAMRKAGLDTVQIGIEALSSNLLQKMNKRMRFIQNLQVLKYCEELNIEHAANLITHFPGETQKDIDDAIKNIDFASAYRPPLSLTPFALLQGSLVDQERQKYGIHSVKNYGFLDGLLPMSIRDKLDFQLKSYKMQRAFPKYTKLRRKIAQWNDIYDRCSREGIKPLSYKDGGTYLIIEDRRYEGSITHLDGDIRKLYLFCDSIRSFEEIGNRFSEYELSELHRVLIELVGLKIMYKEGEDYLSLAIREHNTQPTSSIFENR